MLGRCVTCVPINWLYGCMADRHSKPVHSLTTWLTIKGAAAPSRTSRGSLFPLSTSCLTKSRIHLKYSVIDAFALTLWILTRFSISLKRCRANFGLTR